MKKLIALIMLVAIQVNAQTFNFDCHAGFYSDELYSKILPSNPPDLMGALEVFIDDAARHSHVIDLSHYLDIKFNIQAKDPEEFGILHIKYGDEYQYHEDGSPRYFAGYGGGKCDRTDYFVVLNNNFWNNENYNDYYKMTFLYHELGHAVLQLDHIYEDNGKDDIMDPIVQFMNYYEFQNNVGELFSGEGQNPYPCDESGKSFPKSFTCTHFN